MEGKGEGREKKGSKGMRKKGVREVEGEGLDF